MVTKAIASLGRSFKRYENIRKPSPKGGSPRRFEDGVTNQGTIDPDSQSVYLNLITIFYTISPKIAGNNYISPITVSR